MMWKRLIQFPLRAIISKKCVKYGVRRSRIGLFSRPSAITRQTVVDVEFIFDSHLVQYFIFIFNFAIHLPFSYEYQNEKVIYCYAHIVHYSRLCFVPGTLRCH